MFTEPSTSIRIAVYGSEIGQPGRNIGLWASGYQGSIIAAGATPVFLKPAHGDRSWDEILEDAGGVVVCGFDRGPTKHGDLESLCSWCRANRFPVLAIDHGLHVLNVAHGGTVHQDLPRDLPEALQHRHPPERGLRHAINVLPDTLMAELYGEGEVVVNSEHRKAVARLARGFRVGAAALDGVVESIEFVGDWFALGVQWQPASVSASGLDIQVFRSVIDAAQRAADAGLVRKPRKLAMAV